MVESMESPKQVAPESQAKWVATTSSNLLRARNLTQSLLTKLQQNEAAEAANRNAEMEHAEREKERLKAKVKGQAKMHEGIINTSFQCMQDLDDALRWTEDSVTKLTHERYAGFAALQVCEKRMKMREKRPVNENFKDSLQEALENEQKLLLTARQEIFDLEAEAEKVMVQMDKMRNELSRDTGERRLEMAHDLSSLQGFAPPRPSSSHGNEEKGEFKSSAAPSSTPSSPTKSSQLALTKDDSAGKASQEDRKADLKEKGESKSSAAPTSTPSCTTKSSQPALTKDDSAGKASQEDRKADPKALIDATVQLLEKAAAIRQKSEILITRVKQDSHKANQRSEDTLARRTNDLNDMRRKLEQQMVHADAVIISAERSLARSEKKLDPRDKTKKDKLDVDKALLEKLKGTRFQLQEDIRGKLAALAIDNSCRRLTPVKASESKKMTRHSSAPTLRSQQHQDATGKMMGDTALPDITKPGPPPSMSKSLKAATTTSDATSKMMGDTALPDITKPGSPAGMSKSLKAAAIASVQ